MSQVGELIKQWEETKNTFREPENIKYFNVKSWEDAYEVAYQECINELKQAHASDVKELHRRIENKIKEYEYIGSVQEIHIQHTLIQAGMEEIKSIITEILGGGE